MIQHVKIKPLTIENFSSFGEVISCEGHNFFHINNEHTERYHALVETKIKDDAKVGISIFKNIKSTQIPFEISMLERHPHGSQAFIPMQGQSFLVIVAPRLDDNMPDLSQICAFITNGMQGVNYHVGTWHYPLLTLEAPSLFAVIDRIGSGNNCDIFPFGKKVFLSH